MTMSEQPARPYVTWDFERYLLADGCGGNPLHGTFLKSVRLGDREFLVGKSRICTIMDSAATDEEVRRVSGDVRRFTILLAFLADLALGPAEWVLRFDGMPNLNTEIKWIAGASAYACSEIRPEAWRLVEDLFTSVSDERTWRALSYYYDGTEGWDSNGDASDAKGTACLHFVKAVEILVPFPSTEAHVIRNSIERIEGLLSGQDRQTFDEAVSGLKSTTAAEAKSTESNFRNRMASAGNFSQELQDRIISTWKKRGGMGVAHSSMEPRVSSDDLREFRSVARAAIVAVIERSRTCGLPPLPLTLPERQAIVWSADLHF